MVLLYRIYGNLANCAKMYLVLNIKKMKQNHIIALIAGVIIIGGGLLYWNSREAAAPETNTQNQTAEEQAANDANFQGDVPGDAPETNPTIPTSDTIAVSTQIAGSSVTVDNVFLSKPGFVSIHEVNSKGQPGNIIGTSGLLGTGPRQDLEINAAIVPGAKYIAMVRMDNGDKKFNAQQDEAVLKDGTPLMIMFSVSQ